MMNLLNPKAFGLCVALLCGTCATAFAGEENATLTIIPFSARGTADAARAAAATEAVSKELSAALCAKVAPEAEMKALLAETGLELACSGDSNACLMDLAKAAKTDFIVVGDLMQSGERQFLSLQMLRVRRKVSVYRQRIETLDTYLTDDATALGKHLASGFSCTKEERFSDPPVALKIVPLTARKAKEVAKTPAAPVKPPEPSASAAEPAPKP